MRQQVNIIANMADFFSSFPRANSRFSVFLIFILSRFFSIRVSLPPGLFAVLSAFSVQSGGAKQPGGKTYYIATSIRHNAGQTVACVVVPPIHKFNRLVILKGKRIFLPVPLDGSTATQAICCARIAVRGGCAGGGVLVGRAIPGSRLGIPELTAPNH